MTDYSPSPVTKLTKTAGDSRADSLIYGCMRLPVDNQSAVAAIITQCWRHGIRHFDHADIYNGGASEARFGECWRALNLPREDFLITSKCGIRFAGEPNALDPKRYDFSRRYILDAVDASLQRLCTDYLDTLLLHRPDYLMPVQELAETVSQLIETGKVRKFGVSNFSVSKIELLNSALNQSITSNQIEFNLLNLTPLMDGTIDYCQQHGIQIEAWSPLAGSFGPSQNSKQDRIHQELKRQAEKYAAPTWIIALEWIAFHPANISSVIGTTDLQRIRQSVKPIEANYSRSDWYRLLEASLGESVL